MKTIAVIAGLIALFGIAGTPDYVLDVERFGNLASEHQPFSLAAPDEAGEHLAACPIPFRQFGRHGRLVAGVELAPQRGRGWPATS